jgi:hypothetical protein
MSIEFNQEEVRTLLQVAAETKTTTPAPTYDATTKRPIGEPEPMDVEGGGDVMDDSDGGEEKIPDLPSLEMDDLISQNSFVVVQTTEDTAQALIAAAESIRGKFEGRLPLPKNLVLAADPGNKGKNEEHEAPPEKEIDTHVTLPLTKEGLVLDAGAFPVIKEASFSKHVEPAIGYWHNALPGDKWVHAPAHGQRLVAIVPVEPLRFRTLRLPMMKDAPSDEEEEEEEADVRHYAVMIDEAVYKAHRPHATVPRDHREHEFQLCPAFQELLEGAEADAVYEQVLEPGMMAITTRSQPFQLLPVDGQELARARITCACSDEKKRPGEEKPTHNRPEKVVRTLLTGVCVKGAFDLEYPLEPGSTAPQGNPAAHQHYGRVGVDEVMKKLPCLEKPCVTIEELCGQTPLWFYTMPYGKLGAEDLASDKPKKDTYQQVLAYAQTAKLATELDALLTRNDAIQYICPGASGVTDKKIKTAKRAARVARGKAAGWKNADNKTLEAKVVELASKEIPKKEDEARARAELMADLEKEVVAYNETLSKIAKLGADVSAKIEKQRDVCNKRLADCQDANKQLTAAKLKGLRTSMSMLNKLLDGSGGSGDGKKKRKTKGVPGSSDLSSHTEVVSADEYVPKPVWITDKAQMELRARSLKKWRKMILKQLEQQGEDSFENVGKLKALLLGDLVEEYKLLLAANADKSDGAKWNAAPAEFIVERVKCWPENPLEIQARMRAAAAKKRRAMAELKQCNQIVCGAICGNENFLSPKEMEKLKLKTACLKCDSWNRFKCARAKYQKIVWAMEQSQITDVRQEDTGQIVAWYADNTGVPNPDPKSPNLPQSYKEDMIEFEGMLAECGDDEAAKKECIKEIEAENEKRRLIRLRKFERHLTDVMVKANQAMEEVWEKPTTKKKGPSVFYTDFLKVMGRFSGLMSTIQDGFVPADVVEDEDQIEDGEFRLEGGDDEEEDEYDEEGSSVGSDHVPDCPDCGSFLLPNGKCADACGYGEPRAAPRKLKRRLDAEEVESLRPVKEARSLSDYSAYELLEAASKAMKPGPLRYNTEQLRDAAGAGQDVAGMRTPWRVWMTDAEMHDAISGARSWDTTKGVLISESTFATREAAETYMRDKWNWDEQSMGYMYTTAVLKPVLEGGDAGEISSKKRPRDEEQEDE